MYIPMIPLIFTLHGRPVEQAMLGRSPVIVRPYVQLIRLVILILGFIIVISFSQGYKVELIEKPSIYIKLYC